MKSTAQTYRSTIPGITSTEKTAAVALVAALIFVWIRPISSSLWLDETVTFWVISDGARHLMGRAIHFQGTPLYFWIPWLSSKIGGANEVSLRLPSVLAAAASLWVLFRAARIRFDTATAAAAAVFLASFKNVGFAACDARPYTAALLCVVTSVYFLQRWLEEGTKACMLGYILAASLTVYFQPLFAIMFVVHACFAIYEGTLPGRSPRHTAARFLVSLIVCALLLLPLWPQVASLAARRELLALPNDRLWQFLRPFAKFALVLGAGIAALRFTGVIRFGNPANLKRAWPFAAWAFLPPIVLFAASRTLSEGLFRPRYILSAAPGLAMFYAILWRQIEPRWARHGVLTAAVAFWLALGTPVNHTPENWRGALEAARSLAPPGTPVLLRSALMESQSVAWLRDREAAGYLTAPASFYPAGEARPIPLPRTADSQERAGYLKGVADGVRSARRLVLVEHSGSDIGERMTALLSPAGFVAKQAGVFGNLQVLVFDHP